MELLPEIRRNAARTEEERCVPESQIQKLKDTGLFRAFQPKRYGGLEMTANELCEYIIEIASACSSTAWLVGVLAPHAYCIALMASELQDDVWGTNPGALVASSLAPRGRIRRADGGVFLSGSFGFSSGCEFADWIIVGFLPSAEDLVAAGSCYPPTRHFAVIPRVACTIVDDWYTVGMRGSASKTILVEEAFVPDHRIETYDALNAGVSRGFGVNEGLLFHCALAPYFTLGFSAVAVGIALRMIEAYREVTRSRRRAYTGSSVVDDAAVALRIGTSMHQAQAALAFLEKDWNAMTSSCKDRRFPKGAELVRWRCNQAYAIQMAIDSVEKLFRASGATSWFVTNELQRLWRDVHMCGAHGGTDFDTMCLIYGRHLLEDAAR
jgi:alkylation response protein AidB-like acyl-CoA dehydrogenase